MNKNKKKVALVLDVKEDVIEYHIWEEEVNKGTRYSLSLSNAEIWNAHSRGEERIALLNDGNGYTFDKSLTNKMDYSMVQSVSILFSYIDNKDTSPQEMVIIPI